MISNIDVALFFLSIGAVLKVWLLVRLIRECKTLKGEG